MRVQGADAVPRGRPPYLPRNPIGVVSGRGNFRKLRDLDGLMKDLLSLARPPKAHNEPTEIDALVRVTADL